MKDPFGIGRRAWIGAIALVLVAGYSHAQPVAKAPVQPVAQPKPPEPPRILPEEVKTLAAKGKVLIVDVRDKVSFDFEHAEGAVSIPLNELEKRFAELPKDKQIAAYCT